MGIRKRLRILVIAVLPLVAGLGVEVAASAPAFALGPGSACMFNAPNAAAGFGHVGWATRPGANSHSPSGKTVSAVSRAIQLYSPRLRPMISFMISVDPP